MKFRDTKGREWVVRVDFHSLCRIEDELGLPIMEDPSALPQKIRPYVEMLWICIEDQAKELGVTPEDFGRSLAGEEIDAAVNAFVTEYAVFLKAPSPGASAAVLAAWKKGREMGQEQAAKVQEMYESQSSSLLE